MIDTNWQEMIIDCLKSSKLNSWERNFMESVTGRNMLSDKQKAVIEKTYNRIMAATIKIKIDEEITPTPEHNLLQVKFLNEDFRKSLLRILNMNERNMSTKVYFEVANIDAIIAIATFLTDDGRTIFGDFLAIELKPVIGDDYPGVIRQMRSLDTSGYGIQNANKRSQILQTLGVKAIGSKVELLVVNEFDNTSVINEQQIRDIFEANGMKIVTIAEIETGMKE